MKNTSKAFSNLMFIPTVKTISLNTIDNWFGLVVWFCGQELTSHSFSFAWIRAGRAAIRVTEHQCIAGH